MFSLEEAKKIAYNKLLEIKGRQYLIDNKEKLYSCWGCLGEICEISILLSDGSDNSIFDTERNIVVDDTKKAKEKYKFEIDLSNGNCKYIQ